MKEYQLVHLPKYPRILVSSIFNGEDCLLQVIYAKKRKILGAFHNVVINRNESTFLELSEQCFGRASIFSVIRL